jgi:hypothetical protein
MPRTSTSPSIARTQTPLPTAPEPGAARTPSAERPTQRGMPVASRTPTPDLARTRSPSGIVSPAVPATGSGATPTPSPSGTGPRRRISTQIPIASAPDGADPAAPAPDPLALAREAYKRGQSRLRVENLEDAIADLSRAVELAPGEVDYAATLAWAKFCHASNKQGLGQATREALNRAIRKSATPELARFYLGRVERMLGWSRSRPRSSASRRGWSSSWCATCRPRRSGASGRAPPMVPAMAPSTAAAEPRPRLPDPDSPAGRPHRLDPSRWPAGPV